MRSYQQEKDHRYMVGVSKRVGLLLAILFLYVIIVFTMSSFNEVKPETKVSWYGTAFDGRMTANGELFNSKAFTAASPTLPFNTRVKITNLFNNKSIIVRINDRGPFAMTPNGAPVRPLIPHPRRKFDLSKASFKSIGVLDKGTLRVSYKILK